jgi:hypothetical protein
MNTKPQDLGAILPVDLGRVTLPSGRLALSMATTIVPAYTIDVPESIQYPDLRRAFESGAFAPGDVVTVSVSIADADGNDKTPDDSDFVMTLDNYPSDETKEVLGVLYFNFTEGMKPDITPPDPGIIATPAEPADIKG